MVERQQTAAGKGMAVQQRHSWHGEGDEAAEEWVELCVEEAGGGMGVFEVEAVGVEFGDRGGGY